MQACTVILHSTEKTWHKRLIFLSSSPVSESSTPTLCCPLFAYNTHSLLISPPPLSSSSSFHVPFVSHSLSICDVLALLGSQLCCLIPPPILLLPPFFIIPSSLLSSPIALLFVPYSWTNTYSPAHRFYSLLLSPSPFLCSTGHPILNHKPVTKATAQHDRKQQCHTRTRTHTHTTSEFTLLSGGSFFMYVTKRVCAALAWCWDNNRHVVHSRLRP